ncbi:MAG: hypothetical protein BMS9Abin05_2084 [Rhodothermia bacterium]|nr:MAG: hypothetical protein BMS9Abin05_2084 [Rhodothermia bacterium]
MVKDPVCDMMVNSKNPPATSDFGGETYYFCSSGCKEDFDKDPAMYLPSSESTPGTGGIDSNAHPLSE